MGTKRITSRVLVASAVVLPASALSSYASGAASSESDSESSDTIAVTAPVVSPDGTHQTRRVGRARRTGGQACQVAQARHAEQSAQARRFEHTSSTGGAHVPTECSLPRADRHAERDDVAGEPGRSVQLERDVGFPPDRRPQPGRQGLLDS
mgnify:CR=1 FL=1